MNRATIWICLVAGMALTFSACRRSEEPPPSVGVTRNLLAADLSNCRYPAGGWAYQGNTLTWLEGLGDVWTKDQYGDFVLELEWKIAAGTNSGIIFRCADPNDWMHTGLEVQIHEESDGTKHGQVGAIYDLASPVYYQNARLLWQTANEMRSLPAVVGFKQSLPDSTTLAVKKVFTNLKMLERNERQIPFNASDEETNNPAVLCDWVSGDTSENFFVYPDGYRDSFQPPNLALVYQPGHWLGDRDIRRPAGQWNLLRLTAQGPVIQVELNSSLIVDINLDTYTEAGRNPQFTRNKYPVPAKDLPRRGYIALQDHGRPVWFRNLKITPL